MALSLLGVRLVVQDYNQFASQITATNARLNLLGSRSLQLGQQARTASSGFGQLGQAITAPSRAVVNFGKSIRNLGTNMRSLGNETAALGFRLTLLGTTLVASTFVAATKAATDFERTLTQLVTLTDFTAEQAAFLGDEILRVAVSLGQTPGELAEGVFAVASAGIKDTTQALEILDSAAKASAIGLGEIDVVARAVTAVMLAYGESAGNAARITDVLTAVVDQGNVEIDQFAGELSRVIGIGAIAGVSLEELGAFIATFTQAGASGAEAITSLRATLNNIIKPGKDAKDALAEFAGITFEMLREDIGVNGLTKTLIALNQQLDGNATALSRIFPNIRAFAGAVFVSGQASEEFLDNLANIENSTGIVEQGFRQIAETTSFQMEQLRASFGVLGVEVGRVFLPAINEIIQRLLPLVAAIGEFVRERPKVVLMATAFALVAAALGPLLIILGLFLSVIGTIVTTIGGFIGVLGTLLSPIAAVGVAVFGLATLIGGLFANSLRFIAEDMGTTLGGLAQRAFTWGRNIIIQLANGIASAIITVVQALIQVGRAIASWLAPGSPPRLLPDLPDWGANIINELIRGFTLADFSLFDDVANIFEQTIRSLGDMIPEEDLIPSILGGRGLIAEAINQWREFGVVSQDVLSALTGSFGPIGADLSEYIQTLFQLQAANEAVAASQQAINDINAEFDAAVGPLNDELQEIADFREQFSQQQRVAELQRIIDDEDAPEIAKQLAMMELREIEIQNQIALQEDLRDEALEGAEEQLSAAEAELAALEEQAQAQQQLLEVQIENNNLLNQQINLLDSLADSIGGLGDSIGGLGGSISDAIGEGLDFSGIGGAGGIGEELLDGLPTLTEILGEGVQASLDEVKKQFDLFVADLAAPFAGIQTLLDELGRVWADVFLSLPNFPERVREAVDEFKVKVDEFVESSEVLSVTSVVVEGIIEGLSTGLTTAVLGLSSGIANFTSSSEEFAGLWDRIGGLIQRIIVAFLFPLIVVVGLAIGAFNGIAAAVEPLIATFGLVLEGVLTFVNGVIDLIVGFYELLVATALADNERFEAAWELMKEGIVGIVTGLIQAVISAIIGFASTFIAIIGEFVIAVIKFFRDLYDELIGDSIIPDMIADILSAITGFKDDFLGLISSLVNEAIGFFANLAAAILEVLGLQSQVNTGGPPNTPVPKDKDTTSGPTRSSASSVVGSPDVVSAAAFGSNGVAVNFNNVNVNNGFDLASIEAAAGRAVAGAI